MKVSLPTFFVSFIAVARRGIVRAAFLSLFLLGFASAHAQSNIGGSWTIDIFVNGNFNNAQTWSITQAVQTLGGTGSGGNFTWPITGSVMGAAVQMSFVYDQLPSYSGTLVGTVTSATTMSGTWSDSSGQGGTWTGTKNSNSLPNGSRLSEVRVQCNRGPDPTDDFRCTATVGSRDGQAPPPSGEVVFTTEKGSFRYGDTCILHPSQDQFWSSFCSVILAQAPDKIPAGTVVPVTAYYQGDTIFNESNDEGLGFKSTVLKLAKKPKVCFSEAPEACNGLNAIIPPKISPDGIGYASVSFFGSTATPNPPSGTTPLTALALAAPKKKADIAVELKLILKLKSNPGLSALDAADPFLNNLKTGVTLGTIKTTLDFGETKYIPIIPKVSANSLLSALQTEQVSALDVSAEIQTLQKGSDQLRNSKKMINLALERFSAIQD